MNWFITVLKKYAVFSGRARRSEYWYFILFYLILHVALGVIDVITGTFSFKYGYGVLTSVLALALLIPSLAVGVRRLHDTGRSGWWLLIGLIPLIGIIVLIIFFVLDSQPGSNRFGPNPKQAV